jgi:hypothetical protein
MPAPKVALIDLETAPLIGMAWRTFDTDLCHVVQNSFILSFSVQWFGEKKITHHALPDYPEYEKSRINDKALVEDLWRVFDEADYICAYNGQAFDTKKAQARMVIHRMKPPSPFREIDPLLVARRHFKFDSNKLDMLATALGIGKKLSTTGMSLWVRCMGQEYDAGAWEIMKRYNNHDINLLREVWLRLRPWAKNMPSMSIFDEKPGCPACRSHKVQKRGTHTAVVRKRQRLHCQDCGHWWLGETIKKEKVAA